MAQVPVGGGTSQIPGHRPPEIHCYTSTMSYEEIQNLEQEQADKYTVGVALAILGFPAAQAVLAARLGTTVSWIFRNRSAETVIANTLALFGLYTAVKPSQTAKEIAQRESRYRYYICEYKHLVDTKSDYWDSWVDYAHYAGKIVYRVSDLNTGETWISDSQLIVRTSI